MWSCLSICSAVSLLEFPSLFPAPSNWHHQPSLENSNASFKTQIKRYFFHWSGCPLQCSWRSQGISLLPCTGPSKCEWDGGSSIRKLVDVQFLRPHLRLTKSEFLGIEPGNSWFFCMLRAELHYPGPLESTYCILLSLWLPRISLTDQDKAKGQ